MPVIDEDATIYCWTLAELMIELNEVLNTRASWPLVTPPDQDQIEAVDISFDLATLDGFRAVDVTFEYETYTAVLHLVYLPLGATETTPARSMLQDPSWSRTWVTSFQSGLPLYADWDYVVDFFDGPLLEVKSAIVNEWTSGEALSSQTNELDGFDGLYQMALVTSQVATDIELLAAVDALYAADLTAHTFVGYFHGTPAPLAPAGARVAPAGARETKDTVPQSRQVRIRHGEMSIDIDEGDVIE